MKLTEKQLKIMDAEGHLLVTGGPGSGKTTVSILKAAQIAEHDLLREQKVLFLSFARATVSRVVEAIEHEQKIPYEQKSRIHVDTYHSFFWRILRAHGYLVGLPRNLDILTPPKEAIALSAIRSSYAANSKLSDAEIAEKCEKENVERCRLALEAGRVCFALFAQYTGEILHGSDRIRKLISTRYPVIILDEFQDTNAEQWRVVEALGLHSSLCALADPEQRIYDWIGADPERLNHFKAAFRPMAVDLSTENHRNVETDIAAFGNDILKGNFRREPYSGVNIVRYPLNENQAFSSLITTTYQARERLMNSDRKNWSLAILVPTKKMVRIVSDIFRRPLGRLTAIPHTAAIEMEAAILAAEIISYLMQPDTNGDHRDSFVKLNY